MPLLALLAGPACAQALTNSTTMLKADAARLGYAFDYPPILLRQRLFGLAHGASLLAAACLDLPRFLRDTEDAYAGWRQGQEFAIRGIAVDLAAWYFGPRAGEASWSDLARVIGLRDALAPMPDAALESACTTLPEALRKSRYDFAAILSAAAKDVAAGDEHATGAVPPGLTFEAPRQ